MKTYVEKNRKVNAEQFLIAVTPWPPGIVDSGSGPVYEFPSGIRAPIHNTDWVTIDTLNGQQEILTDAAFSDRYTGSGGGPPL